MADWRTYAVPTADEEDPEGLILAGWFDQDLIDAAGAVTVALTGNSATGSVGSLAPSNSVSLTGNQATGAVGTLTPELSASLSGNAAAGDLGLLTPNIVGFLSGVEGTGQTGTVTAPGNVTVALTGVQGTGQLGNLSPSTQVALTGNTATGAVGNLTASFSFTLTGNAGTGAVGTLTPSNVVALSGVSATGSVGTITYTPSGDVTVSITGNQITVTGGSLAPSTTVPVTGVAGAGSAGQLGTQFYFALTGNQATGNVGSLGVSKTAALTGVEGAGAVGIITFTSKDVTVALSGQQVLALAGTLTPSLTKAITGNAATTATGSLVATPLIALSGNEATGAVGNITETHDSNPSLTGVSAWGVTGLLGSATTSASGIVPYLVGVTQGQASYLLNAASMMVGSVLYTASNTVPQGYVISQSIPGGTPEPLWTQIQFTVSSGPQQTAATATVPNLVSVQAYQAGSQAYAAGLTINTFLYATSSTVAAGVVISQSLTAGSVVPYGTNIALTVSMGAAPITPTTVVPNVTGLYLWDAVRILTQAQLIVEPWIYGASNTVAQEYVISQDVSAGTTVLAWSPVTLQVSSGPF